MHERETEQDEEGRSEVEDRDDSTQRRSHRRGTGTVVAVLCRG
jgi:hypothetical protein